MNGRRYTWGGVVVAVMVFATQVQALAQPSGNPLQDLWENLQDLQDPEDGNFPYAEIIQADPVCIGTVRADRFNGVDQAAWRAAGSVAPDRQSTTITINGRNAIIHIDQDRSDALVAGHSFQFEIIQMNNRNGLKFLKAHSWDHWPVLRRVENASTLETHFEVGDATEVIGVIHASTLARPGVPSRKLADGRFVVFIERDPKCMAIGSFSIPYLPVSILYAPSPGKEGNTTVEYVDEHEITTKVTTTLVNEQSKTVPVNYSGRPSLSTVMSALQAVGTTAGLLNPAAGAIISKCVDIFKEGLGSYDESTEEGARQQAVDGSLVLHSSSFGQTVGGENDDGTIAQPGRDDRIVILRGLRLAWIAQGAENPTLVSLGQKQIELLPIKKIANDIAYLEANAPPPPSTGVDDSGHVGDLEFGQAPAGTESGKAKPKDFQLSRQAVRRIHAVVRELAGEDEQQTDINDLETLRSLFIMDPLAYFGSDVDFSQPQVREQYGDRFQVAYFMTKYGEVDELNTEFPTDYETVEMSTVVKSRSSTRFQTFVEDDKPGWFGKYFLGYETQKTKASSSMTAAEETGVSNSRKVKLHWERSSENVVLTAFYDCLFGTYIFREVPNTYRQTSGVATDDDGNPQSNQMLRFEIHGKSVLARTDENGKYTVYSSNPSDGRGKITLGTRTVNLDVVPVRKKPR